MITDLLDQIDRLDQQATKGPWTSIGNDCGGKVYEPSGYPLPGCTSCGENEATYEGQDAEFIALARTALPAMSKALRAVLYLHPCLDLGDLHEPNYICASCVTINRFGGWDHKNTPAQLCKQSPTRWRPTMTDLPGYYMPHCTNCYAASHSVHNCPYNDDEGDDDE